MAKKLSNIEIWNAKIDRTATIKWKGANGVYYEYLMPFHGKDYTEALAVQSRKSPTTTYNNGKKPGQYQPIGDVKYFTFFKLREMKKKGIGDTALSMVTDELLED